MHVCGDKYKYMEQPKWTKAEHISHATYMIPDYDADY